VLHIASGIRGNVIGVPFSYINVEKGCQVLLLPSMHVLSCVEMTAFHTKIPFKVRITAAEPMRLDRMLSQSE
jgi:hypothetical protein